MERPLDADPLTAARVRDALARQALGGRWADGGHALPRERALAAYLHSRYPGLGRMILTAYDFHRGAVRQAVTGGGDGFPAVPAAGAVIAGAGLPPPGLPLHARAAAASPGARFVYAVAGQHLADAAAAEVAAHDTGRVAVAMAGAEDPDAVLGNPASAELLAAGPVSVHLVLAPARWPPALARRAVARYAELVPPGSTLYLSLVTGDPTPEGERMTEDASLAGGRGYAHSARDVTRWLEGAGLAVRPGAAGAVPAPRAARGAPGVPGQVLAAAAVKPLP